MSGARFPPRHAAALSPRRDSTFLYRPLVVSRFCSERAKAEAAADEKEEVGAVRLERAAASQSPGQRREEDGKPGE